MTDSRPILVLCANTSWYVYNFRLNLLRHLQRRFRTVVVAPEDEYSERLVSEGWEHRHVPIHQGGAHLPRDVYTLGCLVRIYREIQPRVVCNFTPKAIAFSSLAAGVVGAEVVNNITGLGRTFTLARRSPVRVVVTFLYRIAGRAASHTFYQNPRDYSLGLAEGFSSPGASSLLPGSGVDLRRFRPNVLPLRDSIRILHLARLMPEKGTFAFLEAARRMASIERGRRLEFVVAGPSWALSAEEVRRFDRLCAAADVESLGMIDDVPALLANVHAVVLPSSYPEGVPRSLIEAAATGKVLVAYPNPGSEQIVRDGVNGFVTAGRTVDDLVASMLKLVKLSESGYRKMAEAGVALARREFDERIVLREYLRVLPD